MGNKWSPGCKCCECNECTNLYDLDWAVRFCNCAAVQNASLSSAQQQANDDFADLITGTLMEFTLSVEPVRFLFETAHKATIESFTSLNDQTVYIDTGIGGIEEATTKRMGANCGLAWPSATSSEEDYQDPCKPFLYVSFFGEFRLSSQVQRCYLFYGPKIADVSGFDAIDDSGSSAEEYAPKRRFNQWDEITSRQLSSCSDNPTGDYEMERNGLVNVGDNPLSQLEFKIVIDEAPLTLPTCS